MITGINLLQIALSAALFLALWRFLTPFFEQFLQLIDEREERSTFTLEEHMEGRSERKRLNRELEMKRQNQRAHGVKIREDIIEKMKSEGQTAQDAATAKAERELYEFRSELKKLEDRLGRDVEQESTALSQLILERVGKGSGMNPSTIH